MELFDSVQYLKGVGPARAKLLAKLGIETIYDLLTYYPRSYEDRSQLCPICEMEVGKPACFSAMVIQRTRAGLTRNGQAVEKIAVADHTGRLVLTFFNQPYLDRQLEYGQTYFFYGTLQGDDRGYGVINPVFESAEKEGVLTRRIVPVYGLTAGLRNGALNRMIAQALELTDQMPDLLPQQVQARYDLCSARQAYRQIHAPSSQALLEAAQRRISFEEFFIFSAGLQLCKARRAGRTKAPFAETDLSAFYAALPFALTGAQRRVIGEILQDFTQGRPMCRLVQGDVGSGKTMVAAAAIVCAAKNGVQSALLAPTEILAEQHFQSLAPLFERLGLRCGQLTGSQKVSEKRALRAALQAGELDVVIGTHALLSGTTAFANLGLVVTDEQHRFGVAQRSALAQKGELPHLLLLSATPIPRTLSMIFYGDLDVSILDEQPPGRQPVDTFLVSEALRPRINAFLRKQVEAGYQCFVICPAVEESETTELKSAEQWAETLRQALPELQIAVVHGQMKSEEKEEIMGAFAQGQTQILVATTVIEVGVDIPNANLIVIENADRFGLSQLHQLRGRVGRSEIKSYCILVSNTKNPETRQRLKALCKTRDGFAIAQADLELRGPGDLFGQRQHGLPVLRCAALGSSVPVLQAAQEAAAAYLADPASPDGPEFAPLMDRVRRLFDNSAELFL